MIDAKLETLIALVEEKNYTKTADRLYITQPAVSHHIKAIEKEYDIVLFKNPKKFELTKSGAILLDYAKAAKLQNQLLLNTLEKQTVQTITIGITPLAVDVVTKNIFENLNKESMTFNLYSYDYVDIINKLSGGIIDLAIIDNGFDSQSYSSQFLFTERIILVCNPNGKYKNITRITREQLYTALVVMPYETCGLSNAVKTTMKLKNMNFKNQLILNSNNTLLTKTLVDMHDAVAFMYEDSVKDYIEKGELKRLELLNFAPSQNFYLLYNSLISFDEKISEFLNLMKESGIQ